MQSFTREPKSRLYQGFAGLYCTKRTQSGTSYSRFTTFRYFLEIMLCTDKRRNGWRLACRGCRRRAHERHEKRTRANRAGCSRMVVSCRGYSLEKSRWHGISKMPCSILRKWEESGGMWYAGYPLQKGVDLADGILDTHQRTGPYSSNDTRPGIDTDPRPAPYPRPGIVSVQGWTKTDRPGRYHDRRKPFKSLTKPYDRIERLPGRCQLMQQDRNQLAKLQTTCNQTCNIANLVASRFKTSHIDQII